MMVIQYVLCGIFVIAILVQDIREYKIKNITNLIFIVAGLAAAVFTGGLSGLKYSILGMIFPLILIVLYALKMLGAGDVKALCAIGAIMGIENVVCIMIYVILSGGVIALLFLVFKRNCKTRLGRLRDWFMCCVYEKRVKKYSTFNEKDAVFRFSYAIAAGYVISLIIEIAGI